MPLAELTDGETLQGLDGLAVVLTVSLSQVSQPVYNIEVHGEHVYQVGELGVVVHNVKGGVRVPVKILTVGEFKLTQTVANHIDDIYTKGPLAGQLKRPFINSPHLLKEIMAGGKGVPDEFVAGALRWDVPGSFRGSKGVRELVVDLKNKTVLHWNFLGN